MIKGKYIVPIIVLIFLISILFFSCGGAPTAPTGNLNYSNEGSEESPMNIGSAAGGTVSHSGQVNFPLSYYVVTVTNGGNYEITLTGMTDNVNLVVFSDSSWSNSLGSSSNDGTSNESVTVLASGSSLYIQVNLFYETEVGVWVDYSEFGTNFTLTVTELAVFTTFTTSDGLVDNDITAIAIGSKWFGTLEHGVSYLDDNGTPSDKTDDTWTTFDTSDGLSSDNVRAIAIDSDGGKWIGTNGGGVIYLDDNGTPSNKGDDDYTIFNTSDGLSSDYIEAIAIDSDGGKWFGTWAGVCYLDDKGTPSDEGDDVYTTFDELDGLTDDTVLVVTIDSDGGKWIGTYDKGISYLDDKGTPSDEGDDVYTTFYSYACRYVRAIAIDSDGGKWIGTYDKGISYLDDNGTPSNTTDDNWTQFSYSDGLSSINIQAIAIDSEGGKWIGTGNGLNYLDDNGTPSDKTDDTWTTYYTEDDDIQAIAIDSEGGKWFGTEGGVSYLAP